MASPVSQIVTNDSGYTSFEESSAFGGRPDAFTQSRRPAKEHGSFEGTNWESPSAPATPISRPSSRGDLGSVHSRNPSFGSTTDADGVSTTETVGYVGSSSPAASNSSLFTSRALPPPYLPLRKSSLHHRRLNSSTDNDSGYVKADRSSPAPLKDGSPTRHNSPPRLPRDRQAFPQAIEETSTTNSGSPTFAKASPVPPALAPGTRVRGYTTSAHNGPPQFPSITQLKPSTSIPDMGTARRNPVSSTYRPERGPTARYTNSSVRGRDQLPPWAQDETRSSYRSFMTHGSSAYEGEVRASVRSAFTNRSYLTYASSGGMDASETERSSVLTRASSLSDMFRAARQMEYEDESMTVDDAIAMYAAGFGDDSEVEKEPEDGVPQSFARLPSPIHEEGRLSLLLADETDAREMKFDRYFNHPDIPKSPSLPDLTYSPTSRETGEVSPPQSPSRTAEAVSLQAQSPLLPESNRNKSLPPSPATSPLKIPAQIPAEPVEHAPRDRYGFKKASQHVTVAQYDIWNSGYTEYLTRRGEKWRKLMQREGLSVDNPTRFPDKSDKVKRYVRKGIPPEWRGAAWFWYAGGPQKLIQHPGLYWELVEQAGQGYLSDSDREHIERDLNRTFPDNIKYKPEVVELQNGQNPTLDQTGAFETPILRALRRVLQAFAIHNPDIGYCQSLNFLAGLLLLFLDEDEEKAFILLNIVTSKHLPGTHAKVLEANVDIGVLMSCIKDSMPAIWAKIDDSQDHHTSNGLSATRLPTVSLATTSWFMSLFIGTLPIECVLRVWDSFFYEGSKTLFRIALTIFKTGEQVIRDTSDPMEIFQVVQQMPRRMLDANALMETCYKRRNGFGHVSQETVEKRRTERRAALNRDRARANGEISVFDAVEAPRPEKKQSGLRRAASRARMRRDPSRRRLARAEN